MPRSPTGSPACPFGRCRLASTATPQDVYERQRPGASLAKAHAACRPPAAGLPLEITFAPTRLNIHRPSRSSNGRGRSDAFRFNTGRLMRIGTAARLWDRLEPSESAVSGIPPTCCSGSRRSLEGDLELCYVPFDIQDGLRASLETPPATLLVLPNGWVKVAAALPQICADLRRNDTFGGLGGLPQCVAE